MSQEFFSQGEFLNWESLTAAFVFLLFSSTLSYKTTDALFSRIGLRTWDVFWGRPTRLGKLCHSLLATSTFLLLHTQALYEMDLMCVLVFSLLMGINFLFLNSRFMYTLTCSWDSSQAKRTSKGLFVHSFLQGYLSCVATVLAASLK